VSKRDDGDNWWQFQARKAKLAPKIPPFKRPVDLPPPREPEPEPMVVEESDASDTVIQRIIRYWQK
jgi:hypothetical protein